MEDNIKRIVIWETVEFASEKWHVPVFVQELRSDDPYFSMAINSIREHHVDNWRGDYDRPTRRHLTIENGDRVAEVIAPREGYFVNVFHEARVPTGEVYSFPVWSFFAGPGYGTALAEKDSQQGRLHPLGLKVKVENHPGLRTRVYL